MKSTQHRWLFPVLALGLISCLPAAGSPSTASWRLESERAAAALESDDAATAQKRLRRALELAEEQGAPPIERARLLVRLARAQDSEGDFRVAAQTYRRALAVAEEAPTTDDLLLLRADALSELGNLYFPLGHPQEGREALEEALRLRRQLLDPAAPEVIESLNLLGIVYGETGDLEQAERLLREAAALVAGSPTASPADKAGPLFSLIPILERQGRHAEADELTEKALRLVNAGREGH